MQILCYYGNIMNMFQQKSLKLQCKKTNIKKEEIIRLYSDSLTLSWRRPLSYRNQSIDLRSKSKDWFLYDNGLHHERVKRFSEQLFWILCLRFLMKTYEALSFQKRRRQDHATHRNMTLLIYIHLKRFNTSLHE